MIRTRANTLRPLMVIVACVALTVTLSSCSDGSDETIDWPNGAPALTEEGYTAPGATLDIGETATVPRTNGSAVIELTITSVEKADSAELVGTVAEGEVPFHVHFDMEVVAGDAYAMLMSDYILGWAEGEQLDALTRVKPFPPCQARNFPLNSGPGTKITSCRTYLTEADGPPIDEVWFDNDDVYQSHEDGHVTWDVPDTND